MFTTSHTIIDIFYKNIFRTRTKSLNTKKEREKLRQNYCKKFNVIKEVL